MPVHQKCHLWRQTIGVNVEPQRTRHHQNDIVRAQKTRRKAPRQTRLSATRLECTRNLLWFSPLQVGTKCLRKEATRRKCRQPATSTHFSRIDLSGHRPACNSPIIVVRTPRRRCRICPVPMAITENPQQRRTHHLGKMPRLQALSHAGSSKTTGARSQTQQDRALPTCSLQQIQKGSGKCAAAHLQAMAKVAHGVTSKIELKRWTCCSIRVVACVLLSEGGYDISFAKIRLR